MRSFFQAVIALLFMSSIVWATEPVPSYPLVVLERVGCATAVSEAAASLYWRFKGVKYPSDYMSERALLQMTIANEGLTEIALQYVDLMVPELAWFVERHGDATRVGRLARASLKAFQEKIPAISVREARSFSRAYFGDGFTPRGEVPTTGELALPRYFSGFVPYNIARNLESLDAEAHQSAMLFIQALMTESQLRLLGAYGRIHRSSRVRHGAYWRLFKTFIVEEN